MNLIRYTLSSLQIFSLTLLLNACATDGPSDSDENAANAENSNNENLEGDNTNGNLNNNNANNNGNNLGNNGNNLGNNSDSKANEFLNNATGEDFLSGNATAANPESPASDTLGAEQNSTQDLGIAGGGDIVGGNQNEPVIAPAAPDVNQGATDSAIASPRAAAMRGGLVQYVMKNGADVYDKPSGKVVKILEQGDHPLVTAEGEWLRTSDGSYLANSSVTPRPISREKSAKAWH